MKESGILLHISSLPSKYGIGTLGEAAYRFADFLAETGQNYWQILPLGVTGYGNSPYQSASSFAGNPYLIDLELLAEQGLLQSSDYENIDWGKDPCRVDYGQLYFYRNKVLSLAAKRFDKSNRDYIRFCKENTFWLDDFALFMAIKEHFNMVGFDQWPTEYAHRERTTLEKFAKHHTEKTDYYKITQYFFYSQESALKKYLNGKGIRLIGDIPFYTAYDSADVWANPQLFLLDETLVPVDVAGVPPDAFSETGQLWGNPLYDFEAMAKDGYAWWARRLSRSLRLYDILRIDHFRAFESYYAIPYGSRDATEGKWVQGIGTDFFKSLKIDKTQIIAEDLGIITDEVRALIDQTGFRSMKVLQFAFDGKDDNLYLTKNYQNGDCVVYTGTHDNDTTLGWFRNADLSIREQVLRRVPYAFTQPATHALIRYAMESKADIVIIPIQDYLELGSEARMNTPATTYGNWEWRLSEDYKSLKLVKEIKRMLRYRKISSKQC